MQSAQDDNSWQRFIKLYGPSIFRWCLRCGLQESDAADVSQEVLGDVISSVKRFSSDREGATFRGWLWTITRNKIADHCRRWANAPVATGGTNAIRLLESLPDQRPETHEDVSDLHLRALESIKPNFKLETWTAFWRFVVEGDAAQDVADDLGLSVWAVYKARTRVMAKLRSELGE